MPFSAPTTEQKFVLDHVVRLPELTRSERYASTTPDLIDAVLGGIAAFAAGEWAPLARDGDRIGARLAGTGVTMPHGFVPAYRRYVADGWGTIAIPEAHGGQGLPFVMQAAVLEALGGANMALALCPTLTIGAVEALIHHGSCEQHTKYLSRLATGEWTGTMNLTEPHAGSDVGALRTTARPLADGGWAIKGTKIFISFGDHDMADNIVHLVLARTPGAPAGTRGISLFLVPKYRLDADGRPGPANDVTVVSIEHKIGLHASPTCVLNFGERDDCIGELIGSEFAGMRAMFTMMNSARLNVGLQGVQIAEGATQAAVAYACERVQSARAGGVNRTPVAIVEHPDVRRMLMRMTAQTQAARALVYYAAGQVDRAALGDTAAASRLELLTPLAKAHATDLGNEVASLGVQVHGGMGYIEETGAGQFFRDARVTPIYEGTNGIQAADLVGRKLTLDDGKAFAALMTDMRSEAQNETLRELLEACDRVGKRLAGSTIDDRLAASYPFLTMLSVAICGWLMERQMRAAAGGTDAFLLMKTAVASFYLRQIVPEAIGLVAASTEPATALYAVSPETFVISD